MKKYVSIVKLVAALGVLIIILIIVMSVPQWRWTILSVVDPKPVCRKCGHLHVIHDYNEATGISLDTLGALPTEIVEMYGEPDYVDEEYKGGKLYSERYHYGDHAIIFDSRDPSEVRAEDCKAVGFILYSPHIEIRYDIHVGSTRDQIIHAYRKCPTMTELYAEVNGEELGDSVYDAGYNNASRNFLQFTYDENDIVSSIYYYPGSRYE